MHWKGESSHLLASTLSLHAAGPNRTVTQMRHPLLSEKLEKSGIVDFKKTPRTEGGDKVPAVWAQGSWQVWLLLVPEILEFVACRESREGP